MGAKGATACRAPVGTVPRSRRRSRSCCFRRGFVRRRSLEGPWAGKRVLSPYPRLHRAASRPPDAIARRLGPLALEGLLVPQDDPHSPMGNHATARSDRRGSARRLSRLDQRRPPKWGNTVAGRPASSHATTATLRSDPPCRGPAPRSATAQRGQVQFRGLADQVPRRPPGLSVRPRSPPSPKASASQRVPPQPSPARPMRSRHAPWPHWHAIRGG